MIVLAPPLSSVALAFGPVEYLWLSIFCLSLIASLSIGNVLKRLAGRAFGLLLSCVGLAEISADIRLTFGSSTMIGGIEVVSALIGLYCIPVLIDLVATPERDHRLALRHGYHGRLLRPVPLCTRCAAAVIDRNSEHWPHFTYLRQSCSSLKPSISRILRFE
jgi:TctA family transporter